MHPNALELEAAALRSLGLRSDESRHEPWPRKGRLAALTRFVSSLNEQPSRGARIAVRGLSKSYGSRRVLEGLDLDIASGDFIAIVGRIGCGKSTLLRLLAGLEAADAGDITFDGATRGQDQVGCRSDTCILSQETRLLPRKTLLDNVALELTVRDARQRAHDALAQVGLAARAQEWPSTLSGGDRQRVALARALVRAPRLLLLDEPFGALDGHQRIELPRLIEELWMKCGFTVVLVTRDVSEAVALADRVLQLADRRIALDRCVALHRPRSRAQPGFAQHEQSIVDCLVASSGEWPGGCHVMARRRHLHSVA
jgi:sulfonate transport system ATP-binding protein